MKILFVLPFICDSQVQEYSRVFVPPDVDIRGTETGRVAESRGDVALHIPELIHEIVKAERDGYDAVVCGCHADGGVEESREFVNIPVLGCMKIAMHVCVMLAHRFTILSPIEFIAKWNQQNIKTYGLEGRGSIRMIPTTAQYQISQYFEYKKTGRPGDWIETMLQECIHAIKDDDAGALTVGCGASAWTVNILRDELRKRGYNLPFVNPVPTAIEIAKALITQGLTHSRLSYPRLEQGYEGL